MQAKVNMNNPYGKNVLSIWPIVIAKEQQATFLLRLGARLQIRGSYLVKGNGRIMLIWSFKCHFLQQNQHNKWMWRNVQSKKIKWIHHLLNLGPLSSQNCIFFTMYCTFSFIKCITAFKIYGKVIVCVRYDSSSQNSNTTDHITARQ